MDTRALIFVPLLIAGCDFQAKHDSGGGKNDKVTISGGENGNVSFDVPFAKGELKLPAGAMTAGNFDIEGVKMYPGATINGFHVEAGDHHSVVTVGFKAPDSAEKVRAYFVDEFRKKSVAASASGDTITGKVKAGGDFSLKVEPSGSGSKGTLHIDSKE